MDCTPGTTNDRLRNRDCGLQTLDSFRCVIVLIKIMAEHFKRKYKYVLQVFHVFNLKQSSLVVRALLLVLYYFGLTAHGLYVSSCQEEISGTSSEVRKSSPQISR